jgi:hypothetical protein
MIGAGPAPPCLVLSLVAVLLVSACARLPGAVHPDRSAEVQRVDENECKSHAQAPISIERRDAGELAGGLIGLAVGIGLSLGLAVLTEGRSATALFAYLLIPLGGVVGAVTGRALASGTRISTEAYVACMKARGYTID